MRTWLVILLLLPSGSFAQAILKGKVIAADSKQPLPVVNVYISNTSVGTLTDEAGRFIIDRFPPGRYEVVVSCIGYEPYTVVLQSGQLPSELFVSLKPKINELQEVIVEPYLKDGWERWGVYFMENVIGTSAFAADCKLKNHQVLKFRYDKKQNILKVYADEPLVLENHALGYMLKYTMVRCEFNHTTHVEYYQGYPLFIAMESRNKRQMMRWERNRTEAYYGSMMHFMRSLFRNHILEDGFEVRKLIRKKNEKADMLINTLLTGDSIAYAIDSVTAGFRFDDHLQVIYKYKTVADEFVKRNFGTNRKSPQVSDITMTDKEEIAISANGSYWPSLTILTSGYWGWSEKLATMLPYDYEPPSLKIQ